MKIKVKSRNVVGGRTPNESKSNWLFISIILIRWCLFRVIQAVINTSHHPGLIVVVVVVVAAAAAADAGATCGVVVCVVVVDVDS